MLKQFLKNRITRFRIRSLQKSIKELDDYIQDSLRRKAMEDETIHTCKSHIARHRLRIFEIENRRV
jgi:hypothetical protein